MRGVAGAIARKELTFDLALIRESMRHAVPSSTGAPVEQRLEELIPGATLLGTRGFGAAVIRHMDD
jgi:hypothetical protein